jgi:hypothetical protein
MDVFCSRNSISSSISLPLQLRLLQLDSSFESEDKEDIVVTSMAVIVALPLVAVVPFVAAVQVPQSRSSNELILVEVLTPHDVASMSDE